MLTLEGVSKRFGGLWALTNVSLRFEEGAITAIIGPNGSGKTTLFSVIAGAMTPTVGRVRLRGRDITGGPPSRTCRLGVGRTFQVVRPFWSLTVRDHLRAAASFGGGREASRHVDDVLAMTGLADRAGSPATMLTLADCRRLEIARALATGARLLLLDETLAGLTTDETRQAMALVRRVNESGCTVILIEHVLSAVRGLCGRAVALDHGEVIGEGTAAEVLGMEAVRRAYLGE